MISQGDHKVQGLKGDLGKLKVEGKSPDVDLICSKIPARSPTYRDTAATCSRVVLSELGQMFAAPVTACAGWDTFDLLMAFRQ